MYMYNITGGLNIGDFWIKLSIPEVYSSPVFHLIWYSILLVHGGGKVLACTREPVNHISLSRCQN